MSRLSIAFVPLFLIACNSKVSMTPPPPRPMLASACSDALGDVYTLPANLPAFDSSHRGDVIRCAPEAYLSAEQVNTLAKDYAYTGPPLKSGFWIWRLAFRTERIAPDAMATAPPPEGVSSALLLIPDTPLPNAPFVVFAHPTVGLGDACAPSHYDLTKAPKTSGDQDFPVPLYSLAGYGYTVIAPDYAGFGYGQEPGYFVAEDEAHSVLDASRAAAHLIPAAAKVSSPLSFAIVGHSQGGHAGYAAQSFEKSYGAGAKLIGVASYAPFWTSMSAWGAILTPIAGFTTKNTPYPILYSMWYWYSAGELRDGPGGGLAMFDADKQALVKKTLLSDQCWDFTDLQMLGATPNDFFDPTFANDVGNECGAFGSCTTPSAMLWKSRWLADRPALDPMGAPMLTWYGGQDHDVAPNLAQCALDRITADGTPSSLVRYCYDGAATHNDIVRRNGDYVNQWIAARAGLGADPSPCTPFPAGTTCRMPPANF